MYYKSKLSVICTHKAINLIKNTFEDSISKNLKLTGISPPLFVETNSGLNDNLTNVCWNPVTFPLTCETEASLVRYLYRWKIMSLKKYEFDMYEGLYANMKCFRRNEELDPLHSYHVDQWTWEKKIKEEDRNMDFLRSIVRALYECFKITEDHLIEIYPTLRKKLPEQIKFVSTQELEDKYPQLTPKEREKKCAETHGAVFLGQIGKKLASGVVHEGRAPENDDWDLNGDILVYYDTLGVVLELSSMGIRVTKESLVRQLQERDALEHLNSRFYKTLLAGELPFSVGGAIGQSRLCMYLLDKLHVGEVNVSVWDQKTIEECKKKNIKLL